MHPARGPHVVLVGLMGAGKTTVGRRLAHDLGRRFVDTDELVESTARATVAELFEREGEAGFRAREREAVADACGSEDPLVVAVGGGAVLDPENRSRLRDAGFVVWLQASPEVLAARVGDATTRPLLAASFADDRLAALSTLVATRAPAYEAVADVMVQTGGCSVEMVVAAIRKEVPAWAR